MSAFHQHLFCQNSLDQDSPKSFLAKVSSFTVSVQGVQAYTTTQSLTCLLFMTYRRQKIFYVKCIIVTAPTLVIWLSVSCNTCIIVNS